MAIALKLNQSASLGMALMHQLARDGKLDNREEGER